jgi:chromosomal replication initiator protein
LQKASDRGIDLTEDVAALVAERVPGSGRTLEGVLTRLQAFAVAQAASEKGGLLTSRLAAEALRAFEGPRTTITPDLIRTVVCEGRGLPVRALSGGRRTREITVARQLAMYLCRKHCKLPLTEIARRFGRRDHSTVLHACSVVETKRANDPDFDATVSLLEETLRTRAG